MSQIKNFTFLFADNLIVKKKIFRKRPKMIFQFIVKNKHKNKHHPSKMSPVVNCNVLQQCRDTEVSAVWRGEACWRVQCHQSAQNQRSDAVNDKREINTTARTMAQ